MATAGFILRSLLCLLVVFITCVSRGSGLVQSDSDAFAALRTSLDHPAGQRRLRHPCATPGVRCSRAGRIVKIELNSRRLSGFIPPDIGRLAELRELSLANNNLSSELPPELAECRKLEVLNLRNNGLSGELPAAISSLAALRSLDLSKNGFSGDLGFLTHFPNLEYLSLADNFFTGKVPGSLRSFRNLRLVNLTGNRLHGGGAKRITSLALPRRYRLAETINSPTSTNRSSTNSTTHGAPSISPKSSPRSGNRSSTTTPSPVSSPEKHKKKHKRAVGKWVGGFIGGALLGIISGVFLSLLFRIGKNCVRGRRKVSGTEIFSPMIKRAEDLAFLEKEDGVASLEIVGRGGCGEVYRAELPSSENGGGGRVKLIAIKKILSGAAAQENGVDLSEEDSRLLGKRMRQIRSEIQTVGHIRHRNLLPLLAHVARPECHFLVYEYMKNGSLEEALRAASEGRREDLDWPARHRIAVGIAAGLEYLHLHHSPRIIHRDLKPANVLLDDDLVARITDFGLAKGMPETNTHMTTSNVVGTLGFIAPEYHQTLKFTVKCDIYSFGVLLAVLVVGKLPSDQFFQTTEEMSMVKWVRNVMGSPDPRRAIDEKLIGNGFEEQMLLVLKIACFCTVEDPKQRPNSKEVRTMLEQIKH